MQIQVAQFRSIQYQLASVLRPFPCFALRILTVLIYGVISAHSCTEKHGGFALI